MIIYERYKVHKKQLETVNESLDHIRSWLYIFHKKMVEILLFNIFWFNFTFVKITY